MATTLTHIGGPTVLIETAGFRLLTDPTLDAPGGLYPLRPGFHLRKLGAPALPAVPLEPLDVVLLSHDQHADNLDAQGRAVVDRAPLTLTTPEAAPRLGGTAKGLHAWQSHELSNDVARLRITAVPAHHGPLHLRELAGPVTGFVVDVLEPVGTTTIWISGDAIFDDDVAAIGARYAIDLAIAHLGAVRAPDGSQLTMSVNDLDRVRAAFPTATIVPVHVEGWAHFSEPLDDVRARSAATTTWLEPGVPRTFGSVSRAADGGA